MQRDRSSTAEMVRLLSDTRLGAIKQAKIRGAATGTSIGRRELVSASHRGVPNMRLHIHKHDLEPEHINLILLVALFVAVGATIFYVGNSFSVPSQTVAFGGPVATW